MRNFTLTIFIISILFSCSINKTITDERTKKEVLTGKCNRKAFDNELFKNWFSDEYNSYTPKEETIQKLKNNLNIKKVNIIIIFGTWCGDSRRELPRFYKIVDKINYPESKIKLIAIDTKRKSHKNLLSKIEFTKIPTFIFYKNGIEIGRIIESTKISLEEDILEIIK